MDINTNYRKPHSPDEDFNQDAPVAPDPGLPRIENETADRNHALQTHFAGPGIAQALGGGTLPPGFVQVSPLTAAQRVESLTAQLRDFEALHAQGLAMGDIGLRQRAVGGACAALQSALRLGRCTRWELGVAMNLCADRDPVFAVRVRLVAANRTVDADSWEFNTAMVGAGDESPDVIPNQSVLARIWIQCTLRHYPAPDDRVAALLLLPGRKFPGNGVHGAIVDDRARQVGCMLENFRKTGAPEIVGVVSALLAHSPEITLIHVQEMRGWRDRASGRHSLVQQGLPYRFVPLPRLRRIHAERR